MRYAVLAGALAVAAVSTAAAQGRSGGPRPIRPTPATASIAGQVVTAGSGTPVRGAEVRVRAADGRENRLVTTDNDGRYAVRDLTPGDWGITASKAGFISRQFGQDRPFAAPRPLQLAVGERATANLELTRAGVITGRVFDEFGDPVAGARVQVMRSRMVRGRRQLTSTGVQDQANDNGAFRIYALNPGDYYVGASLRLAPAENVVIDAIATLPTYYPGTTSMAEAQRVTVGPGEEQSNVNFSMQPVRSVRVSGVLLKSNGAPAEGSSVGLMSTTDFNTAGMPIGNAGTAGANGAFTIVNVPPGSYIAQAMIIPDGNTTEPELASAPVVVGTEGVFGLTLTAARGSVLSGTVVSESGPLPASLTVSVGVRSPGRNIEMRSGGGGLAGQNRSFRLGNLFGTTVVSVDDLPDGWIVRSIDVGGTDVTDMPFEIPPGQNLTGRVVLTDRAGSLTGQVTSRSSTETRAVHDAQVVLFPSDSARWFYQSRYVRTTRADEGGRFAFRNLPPDGQYLAVAVDYLEEEEYWDPEFLERMRQRATTVSIGDGEQKTTRLELQQR
jgi:hypothetical protein